jgi:ATP-dependent Clp protease ATP-binding subunit ClpC
MQAVVNALVEPYQASALPRELLDHPQFARGVAMLADERYTTAQLLQYAASANPVLGCLALEAIARRRDEPPSDDALLSLLNLDYRWNRFYLLRAIGARLPAPLIGRVLRRLGYTWTEPISRLMLEEFLHARVAAGERLALGGALAGCTAADFEGLMIVAGALDADLGAPLIAEARRWRATVVDVATLGGFGRVWSSADLGTDDVITADTTEAAGKLIDEIAAAHPRSVILTGEPGTGKTTLVREVARQLAAEGWVIFEATAADILAGQTYIGQLESRVLQLVETIGGRSVLWVVPNVHELLWTGTHRYSASGLFDLVLPHVERGHVKLIGETTPASWERAAQERPKVRTAFATWRIDPLDRGDTLALAREWIARREARGLPGMAPATLDEAWQLVQHYLADRVAPANLLSLLAATYRRMEGTAATTVTADDLVATLSDLTGVPARILDERVGLDLGELRQFFASRVMGQTEAVECLVDRVAMIKAGLTDPSRPLGVFLFVGPTGTGKTEIAKTLAEYLFGSADRMIRLDMSEFQTPDSLERLVGGAADPNDRDAGLVRAIRKAPFSVVLLDEFEKAAPPVWNLFLQVFDDGRLADRRGVTADFRHAVVIMTSNLGAAVASSAGVGFTGEEGPFSPTGVDRAVARTFAPEFLNRVDRIVVFRPLSRAVMRDILEKELAAVLQRRGLRSRSWAVEWDASAIDFLLGRGFTPHLGARPLKRAVERYVLAPLAAAIVNREVPAGDQFLFVRADADGIDVVFVDPDAPDPAAEPAGAPAPAIATEPAPSLEAIVLAPRGTLAEIELLQRAYRRLGERLAAPDWTQRKEGALAEMKRPEFWESPGRFAVLGLAEFLDRVDDAFAKAGSLLRRVAGTGAPRERAPRDVVGRLAQLLWLMDTARVPARHRGARRWRRRRGERRLRAPARPHVRRVGHGPAHALRDARRRPGRRRVPLPARRFRLRGVRDPRPRAGPARARRGAGRARPPHSRPGDGRPAAGRAAARRRPARPGPAGAGRRAGDRRDRAPLPRGAVAARTRRRPRLAHRPPGPTATSTSCSNPRHDRRQARGRPQVLAQHSRDRRHDAGAPQGRSHSRAVDAGHDPADRADRDHGHAALPRGGAGDRRHARRRRAPRGDTRRDDAHDHRRADRARPPPARLQGRGARRARRVRQGYARALRHRRRAAPAAAAGQGRPLESREAVTCCGPAPGARRAFLTAALAAVAAACAGPTTDGSARRQDDLLKQGGAALGPIVDPHAHPGQFALVRTGELPLAALEEMKAAHVRCAFFAAVGDGAVIRREPTGIRNHRNPQPRELYRSTIGQLGRVRARGGDGSARLVLSRGDLAALRTETRTAALMAIEGGDPLDGQLDRVREFHEFGVRSIQLVHFRVNELGDIQTEPPRHGRLTDVGAGVVREMNRLGMVVDGAHAPTATLRGILDASRTPIIVSHTGPAALRPSVRRHLSDDDMRAVAARGGVIGIWPLVRARPAPLDGFLADLRHAATTVGIDHVMFATDMTGMSTETAILTYTEFAAVPAALLAAGFSESDARKILGANLLRVMEQSLPA